MATTSRSNPVVPILAGPPIPVEDALTPLEANHIRSLRERHFLFTFKIPQFSRKDGRQLWENIFRPFGPSLSSKSPFYGCIIYSLYIHKARDDHLPFTIKFYEGTQEVIKSNALDDIVYGCYAVCMYGLRTGLNFEEIMKHSTGFRLGMVDLVNQLVDEELILPECMWEKLVWFMADKTIFRFAPQGNILSSWRNFSDPITFPHPRTSPPWIKEALCVLHVKTQFVRYLVAL
jgi:hypothetical protein